MDIKVMKSAMINNKIRPVLNTIKVKDGYAYSTNLEASIITKTNLEDGLYDTNGFKVSSVMVNNKIVKVEQDEFPTIKIPNELQTIGDYDIKNLLKALKVSKNYMGSMESVEINGIRFEENDLVATNRYALIQHNIENTTIPATVPQHTVKVLEKVLLAEKDGKVIMKKSDNQITFETKNYIIISRIIDLPFPNYKNIMERVNNDIIVRVDRKNLIALFKKHLLVNKSSQTAKHSSILNITMDGNMNIESKNTTNTIDDNIDIVTNDEIRISLNIKFINDFISKLKCEYVQMKFKNNVSAVEIVPELEDGYLLTMPLAIRDDD